MTAINYTAPPTCAAFMKSEAFVRIIAGPVGSGKTTACLFELFRRACAQTPDQHGIRHTRFAILRQTLAQLKSTVLKDILLWLQGVASWKVSDSTIFIEAGDVRSEWILIPLENIEDQRRLLSSQLTGAWISECIEIDSNFIDAISGRCGRFPSAMSGGATWSGIIADTNMPSENSDWHKLMDLEIPVDWQVFKQPGGLEPEAENLEWLVQTPATLRLPVDDPIRKTQGRKYYERLARGNNPDWVRRYVHAQYGDDPSGTAVFRESFKSAFHVVPEIIPAKGAVLLIGQDFGRDPCSVITQIDYKGRFLVLEEVMAEDIGLEQHLKTALRPALMQARYLGLPVVIIGDPSGRAKDSLYEETSFDLIKRAGFSCYPAPTNDIDPRIRAVEAFLLAQRDGGPAMVIDRGRCPNLVRAMGGGYRFAKTRNGKTQPVPDKSSPYSHISDALQYAALSAHGGLAGIIVNRMKRGGPSRREQPRAQGWT